MLQTEVSRRTLKIFNGDSENSYKTSTALSRLLNMYIVKNRLKIHLHYPPSKYEHNGISLSSPPRAAKLGSTCKGFQSPLSRYKAACRNREGVRTSRSHLEIHDRLRNVSQSILLIIYSTTKQIKWKIITTVQQLPKL